MNIADSLTGMTLPPVMACIYALCLGSAGRLIFLGALVAGCTAGTVNSLLGHEWMGAAGGVISLTIAVFLWVSRRHRERVTKLQGWPGQPTCSAGSCTPRRNAR